MTHTVIDTFRILRTHHQFQDVWHRWIRVSETCLLQCVAFPSGIMWPFSFIVINTFKNLRDFRERSSFFQYQYVRETKTYQKRESSPSQPQFLVTKCFSDIQGGNFVTVVILLAISLTAICNQPCLNGGQCVRPGVCACPFGFTGRQCEERGS